MKQLKKNLTCIVCPVGCSLEVELDGDEVTGVSGNSCPRGKKYAIEECTTPMRTVTSTVRCDNGARLSVRTDRAIPKEMVEDCMKIINKATAHLPVCVGDVIIENVYGSNIIATKNM